MSNSKEEKRSSFVSLIEENKGIIFKISSTYCSNKEDQKDLAQDIIVELWKSYGKFNPDFKVSTWMYRIALNVAISSFRKSVTKRKHISTGELNFIQIEDKTEEKPERGEEIEELRRFINQLDVLNKALMILYLEGNSHIEIAEMLNISKTNVGTKISRIKLQLKNHFNKRN